MLLLVHTLGMFLTNSISIKSLNKETIHVNFQYFPKVSSVQGKYRKLTQNYFHL